MVAGEESSDLGAPPGATPEPLLDTVLLNLEEECVMWGGKAGAEGAVPDLALG